VNQGKAHGRNKNGRGPKKGNCQLFAHMSGLKGRKKRVIKKSSGLCATMEKKLGGGQNQDDDAFWGRALRSGGKKMLGRTRWQKKLKNFPWEKKKNAP